MMDVSAQSVVQATHCLERARVIKIPLVPRLLVISRTVGDSECVAALFSRKRT